MFVSSQSSGVKLRIFLTALIVVVSVSSATAHRTERVIDSWKPLNYNVFLTFNDQLTELTSARTEMTVLSLNDGLSQIKLDFGELPVDSVTVDNQTPQYERSPGFLKIRLPKIPARGTRLLIIVSYHGTPRDGLVLTNDKAGKPSAIGDNWPNRVHHWIPCLDHPSGKATVTFSVTVPTRETVVANGKLTRVAITSQTTRTWTWTEAVPIPPYCMIVAVGEFARLEPAPLEITWLAYYVPQTDKEFAMQGFAPANPSLKFFSQTIAPYPYEKLALIIGATRFGGMENSSAIVFASSLFDPRPGSQMSSVFKIREGIVEVVSHEIAHQWFGDSVTESTWSDLWLSEGFATYFAGLFIQRHEGEKAFQQYMRDAADEYLRYEKKTRTPVHDTETEDLFQLLNPNNYQKGAWILHMLRGMMGDEKFFRGLGTYYKQHAGATATSEDLRVALEQASGMKLNQFFSRWIYGSGHPIYELSWTRGRFQGRAVVSINLRQTQKGEPFVMPIPIEIITAQGTQRTIIRSIGRETTVRIPLDARPSAVRVDPDEIVLKEISRKEFPPLSSPLSTPVPK
jgi:aminopeptidase N